MCEGRCRGHLRASHCRTPNRPTQHLRLGETTAGRAHRRIWVGIVFCLVLLLMIIFILQHRQSVQISCFALRGHLPLAMAMLLPAVGAVVLAAIAGSLRIWQLRRNIRGTHHHVGEYLAHRSTPQPPHYA